MVNLDKKKSNKIKMKKKVELAIIRCGEGYTILQCPAMLEYNSKDPEDHQYILTPNQNKKITKLIKNNQIKRGAFLSATVDIEKSLGQLISTFFISSDSDKCQMFHDVILDTTMLTFQQKFKIFKYILINSEFKGFTKKSKDIFFHDINHIIEIRNAFAHGSIFIDYKTELTYINYFNSSKNKVDCLLTDNAFFDLLEHKIADINYIFQTHKNEQQYPLPDGFTYAPINIIFRSDDKNHDFIDLPVKTLKLKNGGLSF